MNTTAGTGVRILLAGYFGAGNLGDEAILAATLSAFRNHLGADFAPLVAAYDHDRVARMHGEVETVDVWSIDALARAVERVDFVVWGGGGLLQDHWFVPAETLLANARGGVPAHVRVPLLAALKGTPCMMYGQGVGPLTHPESRRAAALACRSLAAITVRDEASAELLRACGVHDPPIVVTADPALSILPTDPGSIAMHLLALGLRPDARPLVAVIPRLPPNGDRAWIEPLIDALRQTAVARGGSVVFVAFDSGPDGDAALCQELAAQLGGLPTAAALTTPLGPADCAGVLGLCDLVVATRLHGLVLAAAAGTPAIALDYDPKVRAMAERLAPDVPVLALAQLDPTRLTLEIEVALDETSCRRLKLAEKLTVLRREEAVNVQIALGLLGDRGPRAQVGSGSRMDATPQPAPRIAEIEWERQELQRQLNLLRSSRLVRGVEHYWRWIGQGSGSFLARMIGRAHRLVVRPHSPSTSTPQPASPDLDARPETPHPWPELPVFAQAVRERQAIGVVLVLSGTRMDESEGQRPMQLALALARRGFAVVFAFWRWSPDELSFQDYLAHGIFQVPLDVLTARPELVLEGFGDFANRLLMIEFPHPSFLPTLGLARHHGWTAVYDVLDDWAEFHRVGQATWYDESVERRIARDVSLVSVVTPGLARRMRSLGAEAILMVPNGLRLDIAEIREDIRLTRGRITVGYFGYLAGAWFDWQLVINAARARPTWRFYVIGYGGSPDVGEAPENLELLGKKPQRMLASFAANWDVAIVPFRADTLAAAADPIKTYEYLAMGLPVVVTGAKAPAGAEKLVIEAEGLDGFLRAIEQAAATRDHGAENRRQWAASQSWDARLSSLLSGLGANSGRIACSETTWERT